MPIECCPLEIVGVESWETIAMVDLFEKGHPPVGGGTLDQTQNFLKAAAFIISDKTFLKNKLGLI
jgi:hypothetical protein